MNLRRTVLVCVLAGGIPAALLLAQEREDRTLLPDYMFGEFNTLLGQKKTVMEIRDFLSGEFDPLALADLTDYLRAQEKLGFMKQVPVQTQASK